VLIDLHNGAAVCSQCSKNGF